MKKPSGIDARSMAEILLAMMIPVEVFRIMLGV